jgi:acetolactate synthase regulatory subunit
MAEDAKSRLFLIETGTAPDALLRVLSVCAARQVPLAAVAFNEGSDGGQVRIETRLGEADAARLCAQLQGLPSVRGVSMGWRASP